jgi:hypothetical protein
MAIEEFYARSETDAVTFSKDRKLRFSASLVKRLSLEKHQRHPQPMKQAPEIWCCKPSREQTNVELRLSK